MKEKCSTIAEALDSISSLAELEAFSAALRDDTLKTKTPTQEDHRRMARMKIEFQRAAR